MPENYYSREILSSSVSFSNSQQVDDLIQLDHMEYLKQGRQLEARGCLEQYIGGTEEIKRRIRVFILSWYVCPAQQSLQLYYDACERTVLLLVVPTKKTVKLGWIMGFSKLFYFFVRLGSKSWRPSKELRFMRENHLL